MNQGGRPRSSASVKKGRSESKEQLKIREEQEKRLLGGQEKISEIPDYLDDLAKAYYKFLTTELEIGGILSNLDIPLLEQTADCLSKIRQLDMLLNEEGLIIYRKDRGGQLVSVENPAVKTKMQYLNQFKQLGTQLCLSPSARAQLAGLQLQAKQDEEDPVLKILRGDV